MTQHSLRGHIAYVPQDPQMLHRTIAENICYGMEDGRGVDMDLVRRVGRAAYVDEFVERLPDGYETLVGERGMKLSGGQRQRVAIAQAMAKRAKVLVLDEATSALDSESESLVQEALWHLMEGTTALVVAHRLATIAQLDRIVVLDRGRVVEQGTHAELLSVPVAPASTGVCGRTSREGSSRPEQAAALAGNRTSLFRRPRAVLVPDCSGVSACPDDRRHRCPQGEIDPEGRRPAGGVDDVDETFMGLGDRLGDGEAEAGPGDAHLRGGREPVEALEEPVELALGDARLLRRGPGPWRRSPRCRR